MEELMKVIQGAFDNSLDATCCIKVLEYKDDPIVEYIAFNNEFSRIIGEKATEFLNRQISLTQIESLSNTKVISDLIRKTMGEDGEVTIEYNNAYTGKTYKIRGFKIDKDCICLSMVDVTDYKKAQTDAQNMYMLACTSAEQLKYKMDLLTTTQEELKRVNRIHEIIFSVSGDGFFYKNYDTGVFYAADSFYQMFMYDGIRPIDNSSIMNALCEQDVFEYARARESAISQHSEGVSKEVRLYDGQTWLSTNLKFTYNDNGKLVEEIGFFNDVTTVKNQQQELAYNAFFDSTTKLMNRSYFTKMFESDIHKASNEGVSIQILYIDIDDFKMVNDSVGFHLGDNLILEFSRILRRLENDNVRISRFDSDEFVIEIYDGSRNAANDMAMDICKQLQKPIELRRGMNSLITVSIGIAQYPNSGTTAADVISHADIALHYVKDNGKNAIAFYEETMEQKLQARIDMGKNINYALENDSFFLNFQPQYFTASQKLRGFEALVRMKDINMGIVPPSEFIPVAEENGSIVQIGKIVIDKALKEYNLWKREFGFDGLISINVSAAQFHQSNFDRVLFEAIERYGVAPECVEVEITESLLMENQSRIIKVIENIRQYGVRVSLDDFGTGYSSFSYLKDFPVDTLKIDKSFVDNIGQEKKSDVIVTSIVDLMKNLGLEIIAEGVETREQYDILKKLDCHSIQGFYLGRPLDSAGVQELIRKNL